jgi:CheY-like chemotaxis protein
MASILIVEDDVAVRVLAESVLPDGGYETVTAADATEALALLGKSFERRRRLALGSCISPTYAPLRPSSRMMVALNFLADAWRIAMSRAVNR